MSDNDNVWKQPEAPPPPLFTGKKEKDLVKQVTDELTERVVKSEIVYYPISLKHSNFHSLYGEAVDKSFLSPVHVSAYVEWQGTETVATNLGVDKRSTIVVHFHKRRLTEDKNLFVREGDFILYGKHNYEIVSLGQPRPLFGQIDSQIEIVATCIKARDGVIPEQKPVASNIDDDPRLTAPACDPLTELRVLDGTGVDTGGSGATPTVCDEVSERPGNPPPPLFTGVKETGLVKQVNDEVLERVIGQQVVYFPVSEKHSNFHSLYGESVNKTFLPPVRIYAAVDWQGSETTLENYGVDKKSKVTVRFHKRRLTEDQNLFVRVGDFVLYGKILYEIVSTGQPRQLFGQVGQKFEIVAECIKSREGVFKLSPQRQDGSLVDVSSIDPCDNATFINIGEGEKNTGKNIGSGEGLFSGKVGKELQFKSLVAGDNIVINSTGTEISISSSSEISGTISNAHTASHSLTAVTAQTASYYVETDTLQDVTDRGSTTTSTLTVSGLSASVNVSASAFYGDGSNITGVTAEWDGSHAGDATVTGELSASTFVGDGSSLTSITAANINGTVANATNSVTAQTASYISAANVDGTVANATNAVTAQTASYVVTSQTASYVAGSSVNGAVSNATNAVTAQTASYVLGSSVSGVVANATNSVTAQTASYVVTAQTASFYVETDTLQSVTDRGATTTGTLTVSGISASVNISASEFYGSGLNLTSLTASNVQNFTNDVRAQFSAGSNITITNGVIASSGGGGDGNIGNAEDGTYSDGLFTDLVSTTPIGTAVDRFNEILKILAPSPAPDVSRINASSGAGVSSKLSFGSSNTISGYTNVSEIGSFSAVNAASTYESATASNDFRRGTYNGSSNIEGIVNFHVTADTYDNSVNNYPVDSFGNAETGSLELYLNGNLLHSIELTSSSIGSGNPGSGAGTHVNGNGSGFINVSVTASAEDRSQNKFDIFQHRTAKYRIHTSEQVNGLNYVQVKHSGSWGRKTTNFVQWVKDNDSNALTATNARFANETGSGSKYLSGVRYFTGGTANYLVDVNNAYKNVYTSQNISFTTSDCSISSQAFPDLNTGSGEDETKVLRITGSATITDTISLSGTIQASVNVAHPLKSDLSNGGAATSTGLLIYSVSANSTALRERFKGEAYRLSSGSYNAQSDVDSGTWNSQTHMTGSGNHSDGLQFYNARLYSPLATINNGDFRDNSEGGPFGLAPAGNPNYSGETGLRTFFRYFRNSTGATKRDIVLTIEGNATTIVPTGTALNSGRIRAFVKIPGSTGFMDVAQAFSYDSTSDGNGAYVLSFDDSVDATNYMTFGTKGVANGDDIVLKIEANTSWTGYVDDIVVSFGAGTGTTPTEAPVLDDIDINDNGEDVKLSFGSSKGVTGYTNVSTNTGNSAIDLNGNFLDSGDIAGVFNGSVVIDGELNEDVTANGTSYVANSFNNSATGDLKLEVNGTVVHTIDLSNASVGSGNPGSGTDTEVNGNSSGFTNLSTYKPSLYSGNSLPDWTKIYRTGKYQVGTADQRNGWNYARVIHSGSAIGQTVTNYVEWVNDNDSNALAASNIVLNDFSSSATGFYMSGVQYFTQCTSSFHFGASNVYKNVYYRSSDGISFPTTTNTTISSITTNGAGLSSPGTSGGATKALPSLSTTANSQDQILFITGTVSFDPSESLVGPHATTSHTASVNSRVKHPLKSNLTTSTLNKHSFLVFSGSESGNLNTNEPMDGEKYRLQSGSYNTQGSVTNASNAWDSTKSINDVGSYPKYSNGLLLYNDKLISPITGGLNGDFRGVVNGGNLQAPPSNPNYSSVTTSTREYYRYFRSNQVGDVSLATIRLYGDANLVAKGGAFNLGTPGANKDIHCEVKIPGDTGWLDMARPASVSEDITQNVGGFNGGGGDVNQTVDTDGTAYGINFRTATLNGTSGGNADYLVVRITAHKDWTGHLTRINFTYGS